MPFRYLRDPLFLFCVGAYFVNRFVLKPIFHDGLVGDFVHGSLNDVMCIPFWVPIMVWFLRISRVRSGDAPPDAAEILIPLLFWSWLFEIVLPQTRLFRHLATCDPTDILGYSVGALFAAAFWRWFYDRPSAIDGAPQTAGPARGRTRVHSEEVQK